MILRLNAFSFFALPAVLAAQAPELPVELPIVLESWDVLEEDVTVLSPIGVALAPDGGLYAADYHTAEIVRLSADGSRLWKRGGKGDGPGEFGMLYRLAVRPDGTLLAYDFAENSISFFTPEGEFVEHRRLDVRLRAVDDVVSPDSNTILLSGIVFARLHPELAEYGIHRFDGGLRHMGSFGPVPAAIDPEKLEFWGAGGLRMTEQGLLLYAIRQPYDYYWFTPGGTQLRHVSIALPLKGSVDERFEITRPDGGWRIETTEEIVTRPGLPQPIGDGLLLGIRYEGETRHWDVVTHDGDVIATAEVPRSIGRAAAVDSSRGIMWMLTTVQLEPRIVRATYSLRGRLP